METPFQHPIMEVVQTAAGDASIYLVGGAVRDWLLARPVYDLDFVVSKNALQIARKVANALAGFYYPLDVNRQYGRVIWNAPSGERVKLDFALQAGNSIEDDLRHRDFTINAIALDLQNTQRLIDPMQGVQDLLAKRLHACSKEAFRADPLRVVRGIRFSLSLGFRIEPASWRWMIEHSPGLTTISRERLCEELFRLLSTRSVASGIRLLDRVGALPYTFPELLSLKGIEQSPPHQKDVYQHTLEVVRRLEEVLSLLTPDFDEEKYGNLIMGMASLRLGRYRLQISEYLNTHFTPERNKRALLFFAALYHDSGKASGASQDETGQWRFFGHEEISTRLCELRGWELALAGAEIEWLKKVVRNHMRPILLANRAGLPSRRATYRFFRQTGEAGVGVCLISLADVLGIYGYTLSASTWSKHLDTTRELLKAWWEEKHEKISPPPLLDGHEVIQHFNVEPGPLVGKVLEGVREAQAAGEIHSKADALRLAQEIIHAEQGRFQEC